MKNASILGLVLFVSLTVYAWVDQIKMHLNKPNITSVSSTVTIDKGEIPSKTNDNVNQHNSQNINDNSPNQATNTEANATASDNTGKYDYDIRIFKETFNAMSQKYINEKSEHMKNNDLDGIPRIAINYGISVKSLMSDIKEYNDSHKTVLNKDQKERLEDVYHLLDVMHQQTEIDAQ